MRRKLLYAIFSMILAIVLFNYSRFSAIAVLLIATIIFIFVRNNTASNRGLWIFCIVMYCAGCLLYSAESSVFKAGEYLDSNKGSEAAVKVESIDRYNSEKFKMKCLLLSVDGKAVKSKQKILISYYKPIKDYWTLIGKTLKVYGAIKEPALASNPGTFDYAGYLKTLKITHVETVNYYELISGDRSIIDSAVGHVINIREGFSDRLTCTESEKSIIRGVLFGDIKSMDEDMYEDFKANGTAHVLAVSGLHVGVIFSFYKSLTKKRKNRIFSLAFILLLIFYGTLTLWSVSVTRAIILVLIITIGDALDRRYDLMTALAAVAMIVIIINPFVIFGASFQMSFLAVVSISFLQPFLNRFLPQGISAMLAVQLGMIPYIAYVFNYIPLISIICNIPVIFMLSIIVPAGIGCLMLYIAVGSCFVFGNVLGALAYILININSVLSQHGAFAVSTISPPLWLLILTYGLLFFLASETFFVFYKRLNYRAAAKYLILIFALTCFIFVESITPFDDASLVMVDVGQGDCLHIKDKKNDLLIDGGGNINYNIGEKVLKPYLLKNGCSSIDLAMATHLHTDHYLGLKQLKKTFNVRSVMTSGAAGDKIKVSENCWIELLWPLERNPETDNENLNSLIYKVHENGMTMLVTGDITKDGEMSLIEKYKGSNKLKCDILKIAHHGSKYSTCQEFLDAVSPKICVIGVGKNNYGHPSNEVIEKLRKSGIIMFRTDRDGAVGFINRKGNIEVCVQKRQKTAVSKHL